MIGISIEERAIKLAHYIIDTGDTVRGTAKRFGVSKSTVHTDVNKVEFYRIPPIIVLANNTTWSPKYKVKLAVRV